MRKALPADTIAEMSLAFEKRQQVSVAQLQQEHRGGGGEGKTWISQNSDALKPDRNTTWFPFLKDHHGCLVANGAEGVKSTSGRDKAGGGCTAMFSGNLE